MPPEIDLTVYPDECDAYGHLNQAAFLALFERARWEVLARGPGIDVFARQGAWPAVRHATIDYRAGAYPGDVLRFAQQLVRLGRTSFTLHQRATRVQDGALVATAEFVFVCIDRQGRPMPVPAELAEQLGGRVAPRELRLPVEQVTLAVDVRGAGPALLLVHGYPLDRTLWQAQLEGLRGMRCIAPDLRGFGQADPPAGPLALARYADDLVALLDVLGERDAVVCGLSMGGYVALELARRAPARIRGLVLMATRAEADTPAVRAQRDEAIALARREGAPAIAARMGARLLGAGAPPLARSALRAMMERASVPGLTAALGAMRDREDLTSLLPALGRWPVLVVAGGADELTPPAEMRAMAAAIPGAAFEVLDGSGHLPPLEVPEACTALLQRFVAAPSATGG